MSAEPRTRSPELAAQSATHRSRLFWFVPVFCLVYAAALAAGVFDPARGVLEGMTMRELRDARAIAGLLVGLLGRGALEVARFIPLGALCMLTLSRCLPSPRDNARVFRAVAIAMLVFFVCWLRAGVRMPSAVALMLPAMGAVIGAGAAAAWPWSAREGRRLVVRFSVLSGLLVLVGSGLLLLCVQGEPLEGEPRSIGSDQRRHLVGLFRGRDPRKLAEGDTRTLTLSARQLDELVAWGASVGVKTARTHVSLQQDRVGLRLALPVPRTALWLNVRAASSVALREGRIILNGSRLQIGHLSLPAFLVDGLVGEAMTEVERLPEARAVLAAIQSLSVEAREVRVTYGPLTLPTGLFARLIWGEEGSADIRHSVEAYVQHLLDTLRAVPAGDRRFSMAIEQAFRLARSRSAHGSAVMENRAALIALGIVLGHPRLAKAVGEHLAPGRVAAISALRDGTTLRGRGDLPRHYTVSCALTVISSVDPSNAVGLLKEELDADGGSGFSFVDLLADRAGTTLAERATRDESAALEVQVRLARTLAVDDLVPSFEGLPEGISAANLESDYGGAHGSRFRRIDDDIEGRIRKLAVLAGE